MFLSFPLKYLCGNFELLNEAPNVTGTSNLHAIVEKSIN
jgi:hypothetical protein